MNPFDFHKNIPTNIPAKDIYGRNIISERDLERGSKFSNYNSLLSLKNSIIYKDGGLGLENNGSQNVMGW